MDMTTFSPALPMFLLLAALALGIWQRFTVGGSTAIRTTRAPLTTAAGTMPGADALRVDPQPSYR